MSGIILRRDRTGPIVQHPRRDPVCGETNGEHPDISETGSRGGESGLPGDERVQPVPQSSVGHWVYDDYRGVGGVWAVEGFGEGGW